MARREGLFWAEGKVQARLIPAGRMLRGLFLELIAGCSWLPARQRAPARGEDEPVEHLPFGWDVLAPLLLFL